MLWLNILGLDAPLVALVWQDFFARNLRVELHWVQRAVLVLSIWLAYAADRWLDGWKIPRGAAITARHRFAQNYRVPLAWVWSIVLCGTVTLALATIPARLFQDGLLLVGFVAIYFCLVQWPRTAWALRGFKEIAVALLFAAGTMIFVLPQTRCADAGVWWAMAGWFLLCFLNCYAIASWELAADRAAKQESLVTRWPILARRFRGAAFLVTIFALAPLLIRPLASAIRIGCAVAAGSLSLAALDWAGGSLDVEALRVSADLALFTPLVFRFLS